jgi:hypothetical protein
MRRLGVVAFATLALTAPPAWGASAEVIGRSSYRSYSEHVKYVADPGERNQVRITGSRTSVRIEDDGAPLRAHKGCVADGDHAVVCTTTSTGDPAFFPVVVEAGDGDDDVTVDLRASVDLGAGNDVGRLGDGGEIIGGGGRDTLLGGPTQDTLRDGDTGTFDADVIDGGDGLDLVDYNSRHAPLRVDLLRGSGGQTGEGDVIRNVESAVGGRGNDTLVAGSATAALLGMDGDDRLVGGPANDLLAGGPGRDILEGRDGNDRIEPGGEAALSLNSPGERQYASGYSPDDRALDRVSCGEGRDHVSELGPDRIGPDCESFHFNDQTTYGFTGAAPTVLRIALGCDGEARATVLSGRFRGRLAGATGRCLAGQRRRDVELRLNALGRSVARRPGCTEFLVKVRGGDLLNEETGRRSWFAYRYRLC